MPIGPGSTAPSPRPARHIHVTHGYTSIFARWLTDQGYDAQIVRTEFTGETLDGETLEDEA